MIVYKNTAYGFKKDVESNAIAEIIEGDFEKAFGRGVAPNERTAWQKFHELYGKNCQKFSNSR